MIAAQPFTGKQRSTKEITAMTPTIETVLSELKSIEGRFNKRLDKMDTRLHEIDVKLKETGVQLQEIGDDIRKIKQFVPLDNADFKIHVQQSKSVVKKKAAKKK